MKKFFVVFTLFAALVFVGGCGGGGSKPADGGDTGETVTDEDSDTADSEPTDDSEPSDTAPEDPDNPDTTPDNPDSDDPDTTPDNGDSQPDNDTDADTDQVVAAEEGIYLGIIGFNNDLTTKPIKRLTDGNRDEFKNFINNLQQLNYTALYWADYSALEMMENFAVSPDLQLKKVALVTFTDGLDNQSLALDEFNPGPYDSHEDYMDAIHTMIMDEEGIHGLPVTAYTIGLKGADVSDEEKFNNTLNKLASECEEEEEECKHVFQVSDMNEVDKHFAAIADSLYQVSTTINVGVYIPGGYDPGQVIRYTFDNVSSATSSNLYIEATYNRSGSQRTLKDIKYHGFIAGASTITSSATGPHGELYFQFNGLKYSDGRTVSQSEIMSRSRLWKQTSSGDWDGESEMNMAELPPVIDEDKSSALIMLVLDSTTSLGSDFVRMQSAARNFVDTLVNGGGGVTQSSPCDDNPCANIANSTHICTVSGSNYVCGCNSGYTWNGWQCASTATPCNPNPCTSISNSTGVCTVSGSSYICGCQWGYDWNGSQCVQPSTPCSPNPCLNVANSTKECVETGDTTYSCKCNSGYNWNGSVCQSNGGSSLPECSSTSSTPCRDSSSGLIWSARASSSMTWSNAVSYCDNLTEGGYSDWHLPNIDELKTLLIANRVTSNCAVSEDNGCLSASCWSCSTCTQTGTQSSSGTSCSDGGTSYSDGRYSKFGETGAFWSSSTRSDNTDSAWYVGFKYGYVRNYDKSYPNDVRCVR